MPWKRPLLALVVAFLCAGVSASVAALGADPVSANKHAAAADAATLLARLQLPAGADRSATEPAGAGQALAGPRVRPLSPNVVDAHGWWVVPERPAAVLAYIRAHPPTGSRLVQSGSGTAGLRTQMLGYGWRPRLHVLSTRWLVITVVSLGNGSTAARADGISVWITPRPASEHLPGGVRWLQVSVVHRRQVVDGPFAVTARGRIGKVRALINALPASQPGPVACPADFGIRIRLAFHGTGRRPLAVALVDPGGCGDVELRIAGRSQPPLTSSPFPGSGLSGGGGSLVAQLETALGVKLEGLMGP